MANAKEDIKKGDTVIFRVDEFRDGHITEFDGEVYSVSDRGVDVKYLSGYRSRDDLIPWSNVIAKVDMEMPYIQLKDAPYSGHFKEYSAEPTLEQESMTKIESVKDLPDSGVAENGIQYLNVVYAHDGRIGVVHDKFEKGNSTFYRVEFNGSTEASDLAESEITHLPSHPVFDAYIEGLVVIPVLDENGNFNQDERVRHVIENYEDDYVAGESEDLICYCPFSGSHFELNSKTGYYQCVAGIESVHTRSLHEGAKLAFEWGCSEGGLLDSDGEFLKKLRSNYAAKGLDQNVIDEFIARMSSIHSPSESLRHEDSDAPSP